MNLNQAVITTNHIINGAPILEVIHDEEGDWQFMGGQDVTEENASVVSLEQILEIDPSVKDVLDIDSSTVAFRVNEECKWQIQKMT